MANDKEWQRRTDDWIEATNQSRKRKEERLAQRNTGQAKVKGNEAISTSAQENAENLNR
jgi:hypothetical protein